MMGSYGFKSGIPANGHVVITPGPITAPEGCFAGESDGTLVFLLPAVDYIV